MTLLLGRSDLRWRDPRDAAVFGYANARDVLCDRRGRTVRCTPERVTAMLRLDRRTVYVKRRTRDRGAAAVEWENLELLRELGVSAPAPVFLARCGGESAIGMAAVAGRPVDAVVVEAARAGRLEEVVRVLAAGFPAILAALHGAGLAFRDLYWNHVFVDGAAVALIDAERMFAPRLRFERWIVKDVAGLLSSWPLEDVEPVDRVLEACGVGAATLAAARAKAARIRAHTPKYSG